MNDALDFEGKRCLVTGGSRGLGRAIVEALASRGAKVAFTYSRSDADAEETKSALLERGAEVRVFKGSVADPRHVRATTRELAKEWGGIDALVCNAGLMQVLPLALIDEQDFQDVLAVNGLGSFLFARAAARHMIKAHYGRILFIGSFGSERIIEAPVHYAAAKSALRGMTESLARELGRYAITVNLLAPGLLESGLADALPQHRVEEYLEQCAMGRLGTLAEVAEVALFLLSDAASFVTGAKLAADGGL